MEVMAKGVRRCQSKDSRWGRVSRVWLIGWARQSVTTSCGSAPPGCCLNSLMEPINKDRACARSWEKGLNKEPQAETKQLLSLCNHTFRCALLTYNTWWSHPSKIIWCCFWMFGTKLTLHVIPIMWILAHRYTDKWKGDLTLSYGISLKQDVFYMQPMCYVCNKMLKKEDSRLSN